MTTKPRTMELNGHTAEFIGPTHRIALFVDGTWSVRYFTSIKAARFYFVSYVNQHTF
jgi:hypothetical protein